jgi:small subunit ribosomal protein S3
MGQKVNPIGFRLGIVSDWQSKWYVPRKEYASMVAKDLKARNYILKKLAHASIGSVNFECTSRSVAVKIKAARPGTIIGKSGRDIDSLKAEISKIFGTPVHVTIEELRKPAMNAKLVAETVAQQLEKRVMFRRAMKRAVTGAIRAGALGVKVSVSGRLGGAEIARREWYREGRVPLHTLRADIDYALAEANTTYGIIGIKVWIFKGEVIGSKKSSDVEDASQAPTRKEEK